MLGLARRRELRAFANAYAFDSAWARDGDPTDALLAVLMKAADQRERDYLFRVFWRDYLTLRARRLAADARRLHRELRTL